MTQRFIGGQLAVLRRKQGLTQAVLAQNAGVSKRTIERMESGYSIQTITLLKVLDVLDLSLNLVSSPDRMVENQPKPNLSHKPNKATSDASRKSRTWGALD